MKRSLLIGVSFFLVTSASFLFALQPGGSGYVSVIRVNAPLNPLTVQFIDAQINAADGHGASLIVLDAPSPGGYSSYVSAVANRMRSSHVPVIVRLPPAASGRDSAAAYLERAAAHVAAAGGAKLAAPRSEPSLDRFISGLDGKTLEFRGQSLVLDTAHVPVRTVELNGIARLLAELLNPNLAYVLLLVGIIGVAVEFSLPGVGLPGILGGLSLLISLVALGALSVNIGGLLLILLALGLFVLDIKAPTHGALTAGGIAALIAGSFLLFPGRAALPGLEPLHISPVAIVAMTALLSAVLISAVVVGARAQHRRLLVGRETLVGKVGVALTDLNLSGTVRVANEEWSAVSVGDEVKAGEEVDVVDVQGVHLVIMRRL